MSLASMSRARRYVGPYERARRRASNWETLAILATVAALLFGTMAVVETIMLDEISHQRKALPTTLVCFDHAGKPTIADDWARCDNVRYIPRRDGPMFK